MGVCVCVCAFSGSVYLMKRLVLLFVIRDLMCCLWLFYFCCFLTHSVDLNSVIFIACYILWWPPQRWKQVSMSRNIPSSSWFLPFLSSFSLVLGIEPRDVLPLSLIPGLFYLFIETVLANLCRWYLNFSSSCLSHPQLLGL